MKFHYSVVSTCTLTITTLFIYLQLLNASPPTGSKKDEKKLFTVSYSVGDILSKKSHVDFHRRMVSRKPTSSATELSRTILDHLFASHPKLTKNFLGENAQHHIHLTNGNTLHVHSDESIHKHVKQLLETIRRSDLSVVVSSWLYEIHRNVYEKQVVKKWHRRPGSPTIFADPETEEFEIKYLAGKINPAPAFWKGLKPVEKNMITIQDGEQAEIVSRQQLLAYQNNRNRIFSDPEIVIATIGFSFVMTPVISIDRRFVHVTLTQKTTQLVQWKKKVAFERLKNQNAKKGTFKIPVLQKATLTNQFTARDAWPVVVPLQRQSTDGQKADRMWVLVFNVRVRIEAEERQILKEQRGQHNK